MKKKLKETRYWFVLRDEGNCELDPSYPREVYATSLGHALQKVAAQMDDEAAQVEVWLHKK